MARLVLANTATAAHRRAYFDLRDATDGITAEVGEAGGQPEISTNGGAWTATGIGTLTHIGNGRYYADLTQAAVATAGNVIETRFKSANTAESPGDTFQVVAFDLNDTVRLGLTAIPNAAAEAAGGLFTRGTGAGQINQPSNGVIDVEIQSYDATVDFNATQKASIESEANDALVALHLDHLLAVDYDPASKPGVATALLNELIEDDVGVSRYTANALEQAWSAATRVLTANTNLNDPTAAAIADAVLQESIDDHQATVNSLAEHINEIQVDANSLNDTKIPDTISLANINAEVDTALSDVNLDHVVGTAAPANPPAGTYLDLLADDGTATYDRTTDSLQAIRDRGDAAWITGSGTGLTPLASGTAQGGAASTIQLAAGETFADDELNGNIVKITSGTGAGQARLIIDYTGTTDTATVSPNWTTDPGVTSVYEVVEGTMNVQQVEGADATDQIRDSILDDATRFSGANIDGTISSRLAPTEAGRTLDVTTGGEAGMDLDNTVGSLAKGTEITGFNDLSAADVNAEVDTALNTAIPGGATADSMNERIAAIDDKLPAGNIGDATSANQTLIMNRIGDYAGSGLNTVKGFLQALLRKDAGVSGANLPSEVNEIENGTTGAYDAATDSQEAIRDTAPLGTAMRGTDSAALAADYTSARAGYLDNINGHTAQTGDSFARLGAPAGPSVSADVAGIKAETNSLDATKITTARANNLDEITATRLAELDAANIPTDIDSLIAAIVTAQGEPAQGAPPVSASMDDKISYLYKAWRNRSNQTATTYQLFADDATTVDHKATVSDDGVTAEKGEVATGP